MEILVVGLLIFMGIHLLPSIPQKRQQLVDRFGEKGYRVFFSLVSAAGLGLIIYGKANAGFVYLWDPPSWGHRMPFYLMLPALVLMPAANMPGHIKQFVRHPMLTGVLLWSIAHLFANGDLASLLLFGSFGLFALYDLVSVTLRAKVNSNYEAQLKFDIIACVAGIVAYALLMHFHVYLFRTPAVY
jgi:uncharacterized membrane protein